MSALDRIAVRSPGQINPESPEQPPSVSGVRVAFFFHELDLGRPLLLDGVSISLPGPAPCPERLAFLAFLLRHGTPRWSDWTYSRRPLFGASSGHQQPGGSLPPDRPLGEPSSGQGGLPGTPATVTIIVTIGVT
jgi:hypothetical protein